jgi:pimeloyl-ACP methyl ester carboxylesterase
MTAFLDIRIDSVGGPLAKSVTFYEGSSISTYKTIPRSGVLGQIRGRNVLIGTHGFNVDRANGIGCLDTWGHLLLQLDPKVDVFLGLLWPGDSSWAHGLDYPAEPKVADDAGELLAPVIDDLMADSASISLASHSLGARVILRTAKDMKTQVRRVILMAGAVDDDCLTDEFKAAAGNIGEISVLSSKRDQVLAWAFPFGNFLSGILDVGHPWWHDALGRNGPQRPRPKNFRAPFMIPYDWGYGHHHYLQVDPAATAPVAENVDAWADGTPAPTNGAPGWQQTFSAAFASTRFRE